MSGWLNDAAGSGIPFRFILQHATLIVMLITDVKA
jgi:hypothetical protein